MTSARSGRTTDGRAGFTLVELTIVVLISTIALVAIYQTLITQERTYRYQSAAIESQGTSRMALQVVASELREISASAGLDPNMGGTDLLGATEDSIRFRAFRKVGIVCAAHVDNDGSLDVWVPGERFVRGDQILFYQAGNTNSISDDTWGDVAVRDTGDVMDDTCDDLWGTYAVQNIQGLGDISAVAPGSIVRSYETATYGSYRYEDEWVLGRTVNGEFQPLVGPLLAPDSGGLDFAYFDTNNDEITPSTA